MYATWGPPVMSLKPAHGWKKKTSGRQIKSHSNSFWGLSCLILPSQLDFTSCKETPPPTLDPHLLQHNTPCCPPSGRIVGNDREPAELSASWCYCVFSTSHRRIPFQRINSMILSSELQSNGRDTEPRGTAVKGHLSRAQGEGEQGGREKQHFDLHWSWTLRACLTPQWGVGLAVRKMMGKVILSPGFITFLATSLTSLSSPSGSYNMACSWSIKASLSGEKKKYIHRHI